MADIFISYSQKDRTRIKRLVDALKAEGFEVWWDLEIRAGESFDQRIEDTLKQVKCIISVWSRESVKSDWVRAESAWAKDRNRLVSIRIDEDLELPLKFYHVHTRSMMGWEGAREDRAFRELVMDIQKIAGPSPNPNPETMHAKPRFKVTRQGVIVGAVSLAVVVLGSFLLLVDVTRESPTGGEHLAPVSERERDAFDQITGRSDTEIISIATQKLYRRLDGKPDIAERMLALRVLKSRAEETPSPTVTYLEQVVEVLTNYIRYNIDERRGPGPEVYEDRGTFRPEDIVLALKVLQIAREKAKGIYSQSIKVDLHDIDFRNINLTGLNLREFDFSYSDFEHAFLSGCICQRAVFRFAQFRAAAIWNANFENVDFHKADLAGSKRANVDLAGSNVEEALNHDKIALFAKPKGLTPSQAVLFRRR